MSDIKLYQGDCIEIMKEIPDNSIDCIITDPPYNINQARWDNEFPIGLAIKECARIIKSNGNIILFQGWSNVKNTMWIIEHSTNWILQVEKIFCGILVVKIIHLIKSPVLSKRKRAG